MASTFYVLARSPLCITWLGMPHPTVVRKRDTRADLQSCPTCRSLPIGFGPARVGTVRPRPARSGTTRPMPEFASPGCRLSRAALRAARPLARPAGPRPEGLGAVGLRSRPADPETATPRPCGCSVPWLVWSPRRLRARRYRRPRRKALRRHHLVVFPPLSEFRPHSPESTDRTDAPGCSRRTQEQPNAEQDISDGGFSGRGRRSHSRSSLLRRGT
jgi:hypothetical protein